ncbi:MAG: serine O-acetyltransferase [Thermoleophilia bacterium]
MPSGHPNVAPPTRKGLIGRALATVRRDINAVLERDPAPRSKAEVLMYQGLHAIWMHRLAHRLYVRGAVFPARAISQISRFLTGIEIHPGARIGPGFFIDHGMGVVIGETTEVGADVTVYQGVTLGGTGAHGGKRHPTIGDRVIVGTSAQVLGPLMVGDDAKIGAGSIVIHDVPPRSTVVGNPGHPVIVDGQRVEPPLEHSHLPDPVAEAMECLVARIDVLEREITALREGREPPPGFDHDCLASVREQVDAALGRNVDGNTPPAAS